MPDPTKLNKQNGAPIKGKKAAPTNPYVSDGREQWGDYFQNKSLPFSHTPVKKAIYNAANTANINPQLLYSSAMEEGLREGIDKPNTVSQSYMNAIGEGRKQNAGKAQFDPNQFPIDGFRTYGLDTFGDQYKNLQKKGYLPKGFENKFKTFKALNEKNQTTNSAAFMTEDDALTAKAAMLRNTRENLSNFSKKSKVPLSDKQQDFFTLVGYNAGEGNMQKMIQSYKQKGYLKDDNFLDPNFKPASYSQPYTYAQRRFQNMQVLDQAGYFKDYSKPQPQQQAIPTSMNYGGELQYTPMGYEPNIFTDDSMNQQQFYSGGGISRGKNKYGGIINTGYPAFNNGGLIPIGLEYDDYPHANSGIHIKPENKGKFTAYKKRTGKTTEEALHSKNPHVRQMANFARNAKKWDHGEFGLDLPFYNPIDIQPLQTQQVGYPDIPQDLQNPIPTTVSAMNLPQQKNPRREGGGNKSGMNMNFNLGTLAMGLAGVVNQNYDRQRPLQEYARNQRRTAMQPVYNPYQYGNNSQALFANGGYLPNSVHDLDDSQIEFLRRQGYDLENI